ncbi:MAG: T9SS type A sorting domain-containing protein [Ignavibacteria bacterium]|nr:T9SS type A sorting domain-containing protein [Ignavibacteria bacterium]
MNSKYRILRLLLLCSIFLIQTFINYTYSQYPVVFVSRNIVSGGSYYYPQASLVPGMGPYARISVTGGRLLVREANGTIRVLVDSTMNFNGIKLVDVSSPCVYWDASKIVFSAVENRDSSWRIYEIRADGSGFKKITSSDRNISLAQFGPIAYKFVRYDDVDPCYLPDGRICFSSTRYPALSQYTAKRVTNLYIIDTTSLNLHRITTERNGADEPTIDPASGKIIYSRWWLNIDHPSILTPNGLTRDSALAVTNDIANVWSAAKIRPDGDALALYAGTGNWRLGQNNYKPALLSDGRMLSLFTPDNSMSYTSGSSGIRLFDQGNCYGLPVIGVNPESMHLYIQNPPSYGIMQPPYACDPVELPNNLILISYANNVENQDYGLYTVNLNGSGLTPFYDITGKMELNAEVLLPKTVPPVLIDGVVDIASEYPPTRDPSTWFKDGGFRFDCVNMFYNGDVDIPMQDAPPITRFARINFFVSFQRQDSTGRDSALYFNYAPVFHTGQIAFDNAPANVSMFEQVVDSTGKVLRGSTGQVAHVIGMNYGPPGTGTKCVGCHSGHTQIPVPPNITESSFFNVSTSAEVTQSSFLFVNDTMQYPGKKVVDRKARNDSLSVNWIAAGSNNEFVHLTWSVPVDVRKINLYNIKNNSSTNTNIQVTDCEVFFYYNGNQVYHIPSTGAINEGGSPFNVSGLPKVNEVKVIVKSFTGLINGVSRAGLAEVETNARISYYDVFGIQTISQTAAEFSLSQNYPNPFNPTTKIRYSIPKNSNSSFGNFVKLVIYDITGKEIAIIVNQFQKQGIYEAEFNASNLASGVYFYKLTVDNKFSDVKKMVVIK